MKKTLALGIVVVMLLACVGAVSANLVSNGGFETPVAVGSFTPNIASGLTNWNIESGNIDLIGTLWIPAGPSQSIDLSGCERATISQTIDTVTDKSYKLSFELAGNTYDAPNIKTVEVFWDGASKGTYNFDTTGHSTTDMGWEKVEISNLDAKSGSTVIKFKDVTPVGTSPSECVGVALDDIAVELQTTTPVPEFPTMALPAALIVGLIGAVLFIQKSKDE